MSEVIGKLRQLWNATWEGFSSVQSLSCVQLFATPWSAACQTSLSITNSQSLLKLMSIESVIPSNHVILCHPLLHLRSIFPSIRVFSNESVLHIRWPKYWSFSFNINPSTVKSSDKMWSTTKSRQDIKKQRHYFLDKGLSSQSYRCFL